ncbi:MAG: SIS domain-containing protein, partial [Deltaproteobacteria bacterium]
IARESHDVLYTHAGPEIGVASTKAFTTQVVALYMLAIRLAAAKGKLGADERRGRLADLMRLPRLVEGVLKVDESVRAIAQKYMHASDFLYLGRGVMVPIAFEGALKLKEISYIHAEAYAAGEMKHGPIALIDEKMPVVVIATKCPTYDKVISNLEQVKANDVIYVPDLGEYLTAVLVTVPLQLLAYHVALLKGTDVDQPRNLAKSVTVE